MIPALADISHCPLLVKAVNLYETMQQDIRAYKAKGLDVERTIQGSFDIATNYRLRLISEAAGYEFDTASDEMIYFKVVKPLFNAEAELQTYYYHIEVFRKTVEDDDELELQLFYRRQLQRRDKFARENREIYEYMKAGLTDKDEEWFTRISEDGSSSVYDKEVGAMLALDRYEKYVLEELIRDGGIVQQKEGKR